MPTNPDSKGYPLSGAVLAGGSSRRLGGRDKTRLRFGSQSLLERTISLLDVICDEILISSNTLHDHPQGRIIPDLEKNQGPLGAINSCLREARHPYLLIVAGDMPFIELPALRKLWQERENFDVILPQTPDGLQPLTALYNKNCLPAIESNLKQNHLKIKSFFGSVRVKTIPCAFFPESFPKNTFLNINSPEDLRAARSLYGAWN
ncbi:MAG TPA: molybdenum cofactor guanylyltransferase [Proteobacteria bacterium]|nr:molybdenum cofactor guanylyltransferase [Pseudomonadota bacterium]